MQIVDTFLFSEPYEKELLLIKLHLEDAGISKFVIIESSYTFRGEYKGLSARKMIESDKRFAPFLSKIHLIEHDKWLCPGPQNYDTFYQNEEASRESCWSYLESQCHNDDWVIISDVDEAFDCKNLERHDAFLAYLQDNQGATCRFGHIRFWYQINNLGNYYGVRTPVTQIGTIKKGWSSLKCRSKQIGRNVDLQCDLNFPLCWEYTFCFPSIEDMWKKLCSFIHDQYTFSELEEALQANYWVKCKARGEKVGKKEDWCELIELNSKNSPDYILENQRLFPTSFIPFDYRENRFM
jgi:hypothetical protein